MNATTVGAAASEPEPDAACGEQAPLSGRAVARQLVDEGWLDDLFERVDAGELKLTGEGGFIPGMIKAVLERGLQVELADHLGYEKGDPAGRGSPNMRTGTSEKTVRTEVGPVPLDIPRDRAGSFEPRLVPKGARSIGGGLDEMIISLYAGGMTVRDIGYHLERTLGVDVSHETISKITDAVLEEVKAWQHRPLDPVWPIVYIDALVVKVRDGAHVVNKAAHLAVGVDTNGVKHVLGIWVQTTEGAKFWAAVLAELANRGVRDVLIVCCDGLEGLPEAIEATFARAVVQTCTVHLIRASMRYVSSDDRKALAAALRPIYTAANAEAAEAALLELGESPLGRRYPAAIAVWERAWERFTPFLAFPPEVRRIIYTTNAIESLSYQIRKIIKNRGHFPNDDAVVKLIWLAIRDIEDKRARARAKERGRPAHQRKAPGRLVEGQATQGWTQAFNALAIAYPDRIPDAVL
jgi:putative transposase